MFQVDQSGVDEQRVAFLPAATRSYGFAALGPRRPPPPPRHRRVKFRYPADSLLHDVVRHSGDRRSSPDNSSPSPRRLTSGQPQPTHVRIRGNGPTADPKIGVSSRNDALRGKYEQEVAGDRSCGNRTTYKDDVEGRETPGRGLGGRGAGGRGGYYPSVAKSEERHRHGRGYDNDDDINNDATMRRSLSPDPCGATAVVGARRRLRPVEAAKAMYPVTQIARRRPRADPGGDNGGRDDRIGNAAAQATAAIRSNIAAEYRRDRARVLLRYSSDPHTRHDGGAEQTSPGPGYSPKNHGGACHRDSVRGAHGSDNHSDESEGCGSGGGGEKRAGRGVLLCPGRRIQAKGAAVGNSRPMSRTPGKSRNVGSVDSDGGREHVVGRGHYSKANEFTSPPPCLRSGRRVRAKGNGAEVGAAGAPYAAGGRGRAGLGSSGAQNEYAGVGRGENGNGTWNGHGGREWESRRVDERGEKIATRCDRNGAAGAYNDDCGGWDDPQGGGRERGGDGDASEQLRRGDGGGVGCCGGGHQGYDHRRQQSSPEQNSTGE